ncbi:hypothetical protein L7F22_030871, partial [Adiantum nelumboides]|nr:hypothetical protein [Adiantum nelumboides]
MAARGIQSRDRDCSPIMRLLFFEDDMVPPLSLEDFTCMVYKYRKEGYPAHSLQLYTIMCESGLESLTSHGSEIVCMLVDHGALHRAQQVFDRLVLRCEISWNSLITGYIKCGKGQDAFTIYQKMQDNDFR